ncbi:MAG: hypothetical protein WEC84_02535 [Candidatus Andersenbacteria bacterium]
MKSPNAIGLWVALITTLVILVVFGAYKRITILLTPTPTQQTSLQNSFLSEAEKAALVDTDGDGLPDSIENIYRSDPNNPDTDADGTNDGDEIAMQRDPTKPGPDDAFSTNVLDLEADPNSYTSQYIATLPEDVARPDVLNQEQVAAFVEKHRAPLLTPSLRKPILTTPEEGKPAIERYLASISASHNPEIAAISSAQLEEAFRVSYLSNDPAAINTIVAALEKNVTILEEVPAPDEVAALHEELIVTSLALLQNAQLAQNMTNDFVGGLIGARNIADLGANFNGIAAQVQALEAKYELS